jgi:hypothetical protein
MRLNGAANVRMAAGPDTCSIREDSLPGRKDRLLNTALLLQVVPRRRHSPATASWTLPANTAIAPGPLHSKITLSPVSG